MPDYWGMFEREEMLRREREQMFLQVTPPNYIDCTMLNDNIRRTVEVNSGKIYIGDVAAKKLPKNFVNRDEIESAVAKMAEDFSEVVQKWAKSAITPLVLEAREPLPVLDEEIMSDDFMQLFQILVMKEGAIRNKVHFIKVNDSTSTWIREALKNREPLFWANPNVGDNTVHRYKCVLNFLATLPEKSLSGMTFKDAEDAKKRVEAEEAARKAREEQKALEDAALTAKQVGEIQGYTIHKLESMAEIRGEGYLMLHCMRWTANAQDYMEMYRFNGAMAHGIFSLRKPGERRPIATAIIDRGCVVLAHGYENLHSSQEEMAVLQAWLKSLVPAGEPRVPFGPEQLMPDDNALLNWDVMDSNVKVTIAPPEGITFGDVFIVACGIGTIGGTVYTLISWIVS